LERQVWERRVLGAAAIVGAAFVGSNSRSGGSAAASNLLIIGGFELIRSSGQLANDARVHESALKELGVSFKGDVAPVLADVEGRTLKLSGSVDAQYAQWRETLQELFAAETGLPPVAATPPPGTSPEPEKSR